MACQILHDAKQNAAVLYCSTTDWAFGPVFTDSDDHDADERAESFCRWLGATDTWPRYEKEPIAGGRRDPRELTARGLEAAYSDWLAQEAAQWAREDAALFADD